MDENQSITRNFLGDYEQLKCCSIYRLRLRKEIEWIYTVVERHKGGAQGGRPVGTLHVSYVLFLNCGASWSSLEKKKERKLRNHLKSKENWCLGKFHSCYLTLSSRSLLKTTIKDQVLFSKQMDIVVFNVGWGKAEVRICSEHSELVEDKKKMRHNHVCTLLSKWESKTMEMKFPEGNTECLFYTTAHCSWNILFKNVLMGGCRQLHWLLFFRHTESNGQVEWYVSFWLQKWH